MRLTDSKLHVAMKVRRALRWQTVSSWTLGIASVSFLGMATFEFMMLVSQLHRHGLPVSRLMQALSDLQHPSGIQPLFVFSAATMVLMCSFVGLQCAMERAALMSISRERRLLLKLLDEAEK